MRGWLLAVGVCIAGSAVWLAPADAGQGRMLDFRDERPQCDLSHRVLTIDGGFWEVTIAREGERIVLSYARGEVACHGASVTSVDRIRIDGAEFHLDLRSGPLAPGATLESDGSSEIEVEADVGFGGFFYIQMGRASNHVSLGRVGDRLGINFNTDEPSPDVDFEAASTEPAFGPEPLISLGGSPDVLDASGTAGFSEPFDARYGGLEARGGPGEDTLIGGPSDDSLLGGGGADQIVGGKGQDFIDVANGGPDRVDCGASKDYLYWDRSDHQSSCEWRAYGRGR